MGTILGVISNKFDEKAIKFYRKHRFFPLDFQILQNESFLNPNSYNIMSKSIDIGESQTLNELSNKKLLSQLDLHY